MAEELATNPFLRCDRPEIAVALAMAGAQPADVFAALRKLKDQFKPKGQIHAARDHRSDA